MVDVADAAVTLSNGDKVKGDVVLAADGVYVRKRFILSLTIF